MRILITVFMVVVVCNMEGVCGSSFTLPLSSDRSVCLEFVKVPSGVLHLQDNFPTSSTYIEEFWISKYEITQAQYFYIQGINPSRIKENRLPVNLISWHEALEFCQKVSKKTGTTITLPHELEWEYACRAGTQTEFAFGETLDSTEANYWFDWHADFAGLKPVGSFKPNRFDIYDMHGNAEEWCMNQFLEPLVEYRSLPGESAWFINRQDINDYKMHGSPGGSGFIVTLRGGAFTSEMHRCGSSSRRRDYSREKWSTIGFRPCIYIDH